MKKILAVMAFTVLASGASFAQQYGGSNDCQANATQIAKDLDTTRHSKETVEKVRAYLDQAQNAKGPGDCDAAVASAMELLKM